MRVKKTSRHQSPLYDDSHRRKLMTWLSLDHTTLEETLKYVHDLLSS